MKQNKVDLVDYITDKLVDSGLLKSMDAPLISEFVLHCIDSYHNSSMGIEYSGIAMFDDNALED